jgi:hypothetical protein
MNGSVTSSNSRQGSWKTRKLTEMTEGMPFQPRGETTRCVLNLRAGPFAVQSAGGTSARIVRRWRRSAPHHCINTLMHQHP